MIFQIQRQYEDQQILLPVKTFSPQRIVVRAYNPTKPNTNYFETAPVIRKPEMIVIRIPNMPPDVLLEVRNARSGNIPFDKTFMVGKIRSTKISLPFSLKAVLDAKDESFKNFIDEFCENVALLSPGVYFSDDHQFQIHLKNVITEKGVALRTPARVNSKTKIIEVAKVYFVKHTVPGRKWTLWHEYSHVHKNKNPANEFEADKNGIKFYLGTGNPTIEAYNGILRIFKNTPSNLNKKRYEEQNSYIKNFNSIMSDKTGIKSKAS